MTEQSQQSQQSGRRRSWRPAALAVAAVAVVAVLLAALASCDTDPSAGTEVPPAVLATTAPSASPSEPAPPVEPELVRWGGNGEQLSIVVRNTDSRTIRRARVLITALDDRHRPVMATIGRPGSKCCTILGVPPGEEFGLFVNLRMPVDRVAEVLVRYVDVETARPPKDGRRAGHGAGRGTGHVTVSHPTLRRTPDDAVVTATFEGHGDIGPYVAGQAFLVDRDDRLVAVISGRFYCFADGAEHRLRMQLLHPVPAGTRIGKVLAHPIPAGFPATVRNDCD